MLKSFFLICGLITIPVALSIECYSGTVTMLNHDSPQGFPSKTDCGSFVRFCTKNLLNQRQQNWDTMTTIVYGCDTQYSSRCRYDGCTYSVNGGSSCCCDTYLCNGATNGYSNGFVLLLCLLIAAGKLLV